MITGEKTGLGNCLTISNPKLDDVFSDVFEKSAHFTINYILNHPSGTFDATPFVDRHCPPLRKYRLPLARLLTLNRLSNSTNILYTLTSLKPTKEKSRWKSWQSQKLSLLSLISFHVSRVGQEPDDFPCHLLRDCAGHVLVSWASYYPRNDQRNGKVKSTRISHVECYLKPLLVQVTIGE